MHTLPLGYLIRYNDLLVAKSKDLDVFLETIIYLSLFQMVTEILILKVYENMESNLERRPAMKSTTR